jgi:periplasmic protein TonB
MATLPFAFRRPREFELDMRGPAPQGTDPVKARPKGVGVAPIDAALASKIPPPTLPIEYYKRHSLAAQNWGALTSSGEPLRQLSADEAQATVLRGLLDTPLARSRRDPVRWVLATTIHIAVVAAVVILPLAFTQVLDTRNLQATYLALPRPPAPPPPLAPAELPVRRTFIRIPTPAITMPTVIPKKIVEVKPDEAPDVSAGGVSAGTPGGEAGGLLGGMLGGQPNGPPPPPPPPPAAPPKKVIYRIGGEVKPPRQTVNVQPVYSVIARTAQVEGVVTVVAVIDEHGDVVQARAVSGPPLLLEPALQAVTKWKFEPTVLDGIPVSIEMQVSVQFRLR